MMITAEFSRLENKLLLCDVIRSSCGLRTEKNDPKRENNNNNNNSRAEHTMHIYSTFGKSLANKRFGTWWLVALFFFFLEISKVKIAMPLQSTEIIVYINSARERD